MRPVGAVRTGPKVDRDTRAQSGLSTRSFVRSFACSFVPRSRKHTYIRVYSGRYLGRGKIFTRKFRRGWRGFMNNFGPQETRQPRAMCSGRTVLITATAERASAPPAIPPAGFQPPFSYPSTISTEPTSVLKC